MPRSSLLRMQYAILAGALLSLGCGLAYPVAGLLLSGGDSGGGGNPPSQSVSFTVTTSIDLLAATFTDPAGSTSGPPRIFITLPMSYQVVFGLNNVPAGQDVPLVFNANSYLSLDADGDDLMISDVCFYPYPPSQIPPGPGPCPAVAGPRLRWWDDTILGAVLEVTNTNAVPMDVLIEGATSGAALDAADVYPGSPASNALAWSPLFSGTVGPQQTVALDLDDDVVGASAPSATDPAAILLRYSSVAADVVQEGMYHLEVAENPIPVEAMTWGGVKALYRARD